MVDPVDTIERIFKMAMWVKEKLDQMQTNQELCQRLKKHVDGIKKPLDQIKKVAQFHDELREWVTDIEKHMEKTKKVLEEIADKPKEDENGEEAAAAPAGCGARLGAAWRHLVGRGRRAVKVNDDAEKLGKLIDGFTDLMQQAVVQILAKVYGDDHVREMELVFQHPLVGYEEMSNFCRVTSEGDMVVAGLLEETGTWELCCFCVNEDKKRFEERWRFPLPAQFGQPSDVAAIDVEDDPDRKYLAVLQNSPSQIWLFDLERKSLSDQPVYKVPEKYRMRRILDGGSYRLVVLVDPTGPAKQNEGLKSQTVVLDCSISGFTMSGRNEGERLDGTGTCSFASVASDGVAVVVSEPSQLLQTLPVDRRENSAFTNLRAPATKVDDEEIRMNEVVSVGQDLCVVDSRDDHSRLLIVYSDAGSIVWSKVFHDKARLGPLVYAAAYTPDAGLVVLQDLRGTTQVTVFNVTVGKAQ